MVLTCDDGVFAFCDCFVRWCSMGLLLVFGRGLDVAGASGVLWVDWGMTVRFLWEICKGKGRSLFLWNNKCGKIFLSKSSETGARAMKTWYLDFGVASLVGAVTSCGSDFAIEQSFIHRLCDVSWHCCVLTLTNDWYIGRLSNLTGRGIVGCGAPLPGVGIRAVTKNRYPVTTE